ncbi:MAG: DUF4390 domain-containing protein [Acidobacteria bacterium]|nr:DUF4390 domain-containing protein [Acidobacteriota bacterium]
MSAARRCMAAVLALLAGSGGLAAAIQPIEVTPVVADGRVSASFSVPSAFDEDVREVIRSGLLVTFTFDVELRRPSTVWFDRTIARVVVASSVKFDNLTGVYFVSKYEDGRVVWSDRTQDVAALKAWLTTFDRVPLGIDTVLEPNAEYYVRVSLQTSPKRTMTLWPWAGGITSGRAGFTFVR